MGIFPFLDLTKIDLMEVIYGEEFSHFDLELDDDESYSPNKTRSGRVYANGSYSKKDKSSKFIDKDRFSSTSSFEEVKESVVGDPVIGTMFFQTTSMIYYHRLFIRHPQCTHHFHLLREI